MQAHFLSFSFPFSLTCKALVWKGKGDWHSLFKPWLHRLRKNLHPRGHSGKELACPCRRCEFNPWVRKIFRRKKMATHSSIPAWKIPWTGAWQATVHDVTELDPSEHTHKRINISWQRRFLSSQLPPTLFSSRSFITWFPFQLLRQLDPMPWGIMFYLRL